MNRAVEMPRGFGSMGDNLPLAAVIWNRAQRGASCSRVTFQRTGRDEEATAAGN